MRGLGGFLAAVLVVGVDAQLVCNAANQECLGYASCDEALSSTSFGLSGMTCRHLEDWHCCDCSGCECGDCSTCSGYIQSGLSCFEIQQQHGEDCFRCGCDCAEPNEQVCAGEWGGWGSCGGTVCDEVSTRNRTWYVTQTAVASGTTASGTLSCDSSPGSPTATGGEDGTLEIESCTMPACTTVPPTMPTTEAPDATVADVCSAFDAQLWFVNQDDATGADRFFQGENYTRADIATFVFCEELIQILEDDQGNPIDEYQLLQCGCVCQQQCEILIGGTPFTIPCSTAFECQDPCDYESTFEPDTQILTSGGSGPESCNSFQGAQIAEFVADAFPGLSAVDAADKEAQLLQEGQFGCEYQAASLDPLIAACRSPIPYAGLGFAPLCQCTEYNTTTPPVTTEPVTVLPTCARNDTERDTCFALMRAFPDLDNQCTFFLNHFTSTGADGFGIDCRDCGCTSQCPEPTTTPDINVTTVTTTTTTTSTTTTTTSTTTTMENTTSAVTVLTEEACPMEFVGASECGDLAGIFTCEQIKDAFGSDACGCLCGDTTTTSTTTTTTGTCQACKLGLNCDELGDLWASSDFHRYTCVELEYAYDCDCSNCLCAADTTPSTTTTTTPSGCQNACVGEVDCDELSQFYFDDLSTVVTCDDLQNDLGCDCTGCACSISEPTPVPACESTCGGFSCDDWDEYLGSEFSCDTMSTVYGCDCSDCVCAGGHGECLASLDPNDAIDLCTIGSESRTCDEWQEEPFGGATLTCQYLEFYFGCDCTNCRCSGLPECGEDDIGTV